MLAYHLGARLEAYGTATAALHFRYVVHYVQLLLLGAAAVLLLVLLVYDRVQASPLLVTVALLMLVLNCHCY